MVVDLRAQLAREKVTCLIQTAKRVRQLDCRKFENFPFFEVALAENVIFVFIDFLTFRRIRYTYYSANNISLCLLYARSSIDAFHYKIITINYEKRRCELLKR